MRRVWIEGADAGAGSVYEVERSEAYRDRWVLKLRGVDDAGAARGLRSARVAVREEDAPALPEDTHYRARLVGMQVFEESGERLGSVTDVVPTGGADLLRVLPPGASEDEEDRELLIPMARAIVVAVSEADDRITVRLPDGLRELNRSE